MFLVITHPEKTSIFVELTKLFMTKTYYSRAFIQRTRYRNKFLKNPAEEKKLLCNKRRNFCASLLRKEKKEYFIKLN